MIPKAAKGRRSPDRCSAARSWPHLCRQPCTRKLASGDTGRHQDLRQGLAHGKSLKAPGIRPSVRREGVRRLFHRFLEPQTGRYTRPDPWGLDQPEGLALLYAYAEARPLLLTDPEGLVPIPYWLLPDPTEAEDCFYCLLARSNYGFDCTEQAAWLTLSFGNKGRFQYGCDLWPPTAQDSKTSIPVTLPLPGSIVAQAHSHPTRCPKYRRGPEPSAGDRETARRINRPIFTVSPNGVWRYDPVTNKQRRVLPPNWTNGPKSRNCKPCEGIHQP